MIITSPHNQKLKQIRRLARRRGRDAAGRFVAEGEDLLAAADAAGWPALERFVAAGSGLHGTEVEPEILAHTSALGSGTRALAVYEERWATPAGRCACACWGVADPGNVGTVLRAPRRSASRASRSARTAPIRTGRRRCGPAWARCSRCRWRASARSASCPAARSRSAAGAGEPLRGPLEGDVTLLVGAERAGLPEEIVTGAAQVAHIPIATESLNAAMAATIALYEITRDPGAGTAPASGE